MASVSQPPTAQPPSAPVSVSTATVLSPDRPSVSTAEYSGPGKGKKPAGWRHFVAGGVGGMTGAIVTSPFDVVKTRLQSDLFRDSTPSRASSSRHTLPAAATMSSAGSARSAVASSASAVSQAAAAATARPTGARGLLYNFVETGYIIRNIYTQEGPRALFKGLGPTLIGVVPARAINFSTYAQSKVVLARWFPDAARPPGVQGGGAGAAGAEASPVIHLGAAAIAGMVTATATNPIWVVKTRLQLDARHRESLKLPTPGDQAKSKMLPAFRMMGDIMRNEGLVGFYRGISASYLGVTEGVIQWVLYERLKKLSTEQAPGQRRSKLAEWTGIVGSSGGAKMVASLITYPHEVLRTRLRQPVTSEGVLKYTGLWQTLRLVIAEEGAASLYGGLSAHLLRVVPNAACMFTIYEVALRL